MFYVHVVGLMAGSAVAGAASAVLVCGVSVWWEVDVALLCVGLFTLVSNGIGVVLKRRVQ